MNPDAIDNALVSHAFSVSAASAVGGGPTPTTGVKFSNIAALVVVTSASMTSSTSSAAGRADRIFQALVANAALSTPLRPPTQSPAILNIASTATVKIAHLAASTDTKGSDTEVVGFLTSRLTSLPSTMRILLAVYLLLLGLFTLTCGTRAMYWGRDWGHQRGTEGKGWLGGGVGGVLYGSCAVGAFAAFLISAIVSTQDDPSLGGWATLAIILLPSIVGTVVGGRWGWAATVSCAVLGSLSFTLLLTCSADIPSLLARDLLFLISLLLSLPSLFWFRTLRYSLPLFTALTGSYLFILGLDLFPSVGLGFVDALGLVVAIHGVGSEGKAERGVVKWSEGGGKGLLAAWWLLTVAGAAGMGWWGLGVEGEEHWNAYLSRLISSHTSTSSYHPSQGTHLPLLTPLERLRSFFSPKASMSRNGFTDLPPRRGGRPWDDDEDEDGNATLASAGGRDWDEEKGSIRLAHKGFRRETKRGGESDAWDSDVDTFFSSPPSLSDKTTMAARNKSPTSTRSRGSKTSAPARYGALSVSDDEDSDDETKAETGGRLWSAGAANMDSPSVEKTEKGSIRSELSGKTAVSFASLPSPPEAEEEEPTDEVAILPSLPKIAQNATSKPRRPLFSKSSSSKPASYSSNLPALPPSAATASPATQDVTVPPALVTSTSASNPGSVPVPATPSLLLALDRVRLAQRQARGSLPDLPEEPPVSGDVGKGKDVGKATAGKGREKPLTRRESLRVSSGGSSEGASSTGKKGQELQRRPSMDDWWKEVVRKSEGR
ncbi:hypothetical protein JCM11641_004874 [Rhodosporidiobolus odoratus]